MSDTCSRFMLIDAEHLRPGSGRNIHLVRWFNDVRSLDLIVDEAAARLNRYVAVLDCTTLRTERDVLGALADAYQFPERMREAAVLSWNVAADLLGDLAWLRSPTPGWAGVVTYVRNPEPLMAANLLQFGFLIHELGEQSSWVVRKGIPFDVVVGPLPRDSRYEIFLDLMRVSSHFCDSCQSVDCACADAKSSPPSSTQGTPPSTP